MMVSPVNRISERILHSLLREMRASQKNGKLPYGRSFPAAYCGKLQILDVLALEERQNSDGRDTDWSEMK